MTWWHDDMMTWWHDDMMAWWHDDMMTWWHVQVAAGLQTSRHLQRQVQPRWYRGHRSVFLILRLLKLMAYSCVVFSLTFKIKDTWLMNLQSCKGSQNPLMHFCPISFKPGDSDGRGQQTASPMLTAIINGGVGIRGRSHIMSAAITRQGNSECWQTLT